VNNHITHDPTQEIPYGYCHCGCGERTAIMQWDEPRLGYTKGAPRKFVAGHNRRCKLTYTINPDTGCWVWDGSVNTSGYGQFRRNGKMTVAHRYFYEQLVGPVPDGLDLHHTCEIRNCVNPTHLVPLTTKEHLALHPQTSLTNEDKAEIRRLRDKVFQRDLAARYHVHTDTIRRIQRVPCP